MVWVLAQDLVRSFETWEANTQSISAPFRGVLRDRMRRTLLVLLVLIVADHLAEQRCVLGAQLLRHGGRRSVLMTLRELEELRRLTVWEEGR